ncbi:TPA: inorganic phosphate transporter [Acinetobacter baumannii]|jgi:PiT family inorganic phosphate transporter|uniref:Phosphate transporter n=36 Tax=Gammaproteobacteria TaxID=1236 RepID=D0CA45_ACIB2|nr:MULTISPECIES: inorganic phosphate transporter [Acinetobacter]AHX28581.1 nuclease PIN [Acinetobacter baumannii AC12]AHX65870.1 nuclease PIN [Acinetobacter baumannii AC30]EMT99253.1 phosphate transporter [Acinetobacter baumannii ABNIH10]ETY70222.1 nuclease PIN [Acinetobacter baumannii MDR_MMC4]EXB51937.1 phosphate transporter family protein [Acinetobacter baumannii 1440422]PXA53893.1 inorganic phosphate transporter [Acinetobacter baumannii A424]CAH1085244.1 low-affinity inorganic phosphate 
MNSNLPPVSDSKLAANLQAKSTNVHVPTPKFFMPVFLTIIIATLIYIGFQVSADLAHVPPLSLYSVILLSTALLIALGFEFVNGFHDTANAVATVIYTNALPAPVAVMWAGFCNFLGVMVASGAVAYGIIALLPVELIMNMGSGAGFAMVFALLIAAILWNLGTWFLGIPASSSHTLIGSILGVGIMNHLLSASTGVTTSGVDMDQVIKVGKALLFSPLIGFAFAAIVFLLVKTIFKRQLELFQPPEGNKPPPAIIRAILIFTCTGVSFAHGSNDGQKGMGLIMLILVGLVPLAYSLNKNLDTQQVQSFHQLSSQTAVLLNQNQPELTDEKARAVLTKYIQTKQQTPEVVPALASMTDHLGERVSSYSNLKDIPEAAISEIRNDMYLSTTTFKRLDKADALPKMDDSQKKLVKDYRSSLDSFLQYIPNWVKVAVALALGLGTMVGWKRIVVTVGERIGKHHMTYGQGMSAELVAMSTIAAADGLGMPVSTTHVLNSAVAGTMVANKSGLNFNTVKTILSAWVFTLPATICLSGGLYWLFLQFV